MSRRTGVENPSPESNDVPMKVLIAHNRYASREPSGENMVVDREAVLLAAAGARVELFERSSDEITAMSPPRKLAVAGSPIYGRRAQRALERTLERFRPDIVHLHNPYPLLSPWVVRTARRHGVAVVHTVHNYRLSCVAGTCFRAGAPCQDCLPTRLRWPAVVHGCYRGSRAQSLAMAGALVVHRRTWDGVARFLAISGTVARFLADQGVPPARIVVKPNIVPDPGRHGERGAGLLYVGRLTEEKGVDVLLAAWRRHPDGALGPLRLVGDGPLRRRVEEAAAGRLDVDFLGRLPPDEVREEMRRAAAVVVPSLWSEPFGLVAVEAMANTRPALVTSTGALPELVGTTGGWVVEPTEEALADALPRVVREAAHRSPSARARYEAEYAPDVSVRRLLEIYADVVSGARAVAQAPGDGRPTAS
jgi:glycosyltransferase involved in cell wall biosynthesis